MIAEAAPETAPTDLEPAEPLMHPDGTPTKTGWRAIRKNLSHPFKDEQTRRGPAGLDFKYIDARQVMDRLDVVVGSGNWSVSMEIVAVEPRAIVKAHLQIFDAYREDVGYSNNPLAKPGDRDYEAEPLKAAASDALKRAAVHFGVGRYLYKD